jgi:hypothetical protein
MEPFRVALLKKIAQVPMQNAWEEYTEKFAQTMTAMSQYVVQLKLAAV